MTRHVLQAISGLALAGTIVPALLFVAGRIDLDQCKWAMLAATVAWFVVTPAWMGSRTTDFSPSTANTD